MSRVFTFPAGRRTKWVVLLVWLLVLGGLMGSGAVEKFTDAEENESTSFLPEDAESTKALVVTERLQGGETAPIVVVYRRDGGLEAQDRRVIAEETAALNAAVRELVAERRRAEPDRPLKLTPFQPGDRSEDGTTQLLTATVTGDGESDTILDPVDRFREIANGGDGLEAKVGGPGGVAADAIKVFEGINGTLLAAAGGLVFVLLILIYRSPVFWFFPLAAVAAAELSSRGLGYLLTEVGVTVNGQSSSILSVLVLGAGTDYALLLVSRYREELRTHQDKHEAMALALRSAGPAILASGLTVALALLSLTLAKVNGTAGLGPIGAMGVLVAIVSMLTLLPAVLTIVGRRKFWPFVPYGPEGPGAPDAPEPAHPGPLHRLRQRRVTAGPLTFRVWDVPKALVLGLVGSGGNPALILPVGVVLLLVLKLAYAALRPRVFDRLERRFSVDRPPADATHGAWRRLGDRVGRSPRRVWIGTTLLLAVFALGLLNFSTGLTQGNSFRDEVESIQAQDLVAQAFPAGQSAPLDLVVDDDPAQVRAVTEAVRRVEGVALVRPGFVAPDARGDERTLLNAFLEVDPYSTEAYDVVPRVRDAAHDAVPDSLVGGASAVEADLRDASADDTKLLVPLALAIVFVILLVLLRAVVAPILLIATVVLSFAAALGVSAVVYDVVFGFPGSDPSLPLFAFIFLVALGVDYNIFLMARVREEAQRLGTAEGMKRGLAVTGGVITSAGIVLAGTFSVLAVLPLVFLTEIGFAIAFGVLLDTFLVRSVLVPALVLDIGDRVWWPSSLVKRSRERSASFDRGELTEKPAGHAGEVAQATGATRSGS